MTKLPFIKELEFRAWYSGWAKKAGIDPNPDNPLHMYDYRAAFLAGASPSISPLDGRYHWPSQFKSPEHPNRFVREGGSIIDSITGEEVGGILGILKQKALDRIRRR